MKYLTDIPNLWFKYHKIVHIFLRKTKYNLSGKDIKVNSFNYYAASRKGLLIIEYQCKGLIYAEILNKKHLSKGHKIVLNLEHISTDTPINISFKGIKSTITEEIIITDTIYCNYELFKVKIKAQDFLMNDFKLATEKKSLRYKLINTASVIKSPKLKFR